MSLLERANNDPYLQTCCYATNNNYAFKFDTNMKPETEMKIYNFVPTYDKWCLGCDNKDAQFKCSKCKSVYFCSRKCQKKCWPVHKKHCGRNLFCRCAMCGIAVCNVSCENECPVKWCSETCKKKMYRDHVDFDCENLKNLFT